MLSAIFYTKDYSHSPNKYRNSKYPAQYKKPFSSKSMQISVGIFYII